MVKTKETTYDVEIKFKGSPWKSLGARFPRKDKAEQHIFLLKAAWKKSTLKVKPTKYRIKEVSR